MKPADDRVLVLKKYCSCFCFVLGTFLLLAIHTAASAVTPDSKQFAEDDSKEMTNTLFEHYYKVLGRYFYECPGENQTEAIELAEDIYQHVWGWQKDRRTSEDRTKTARHIRNFWDNLRRTHLFIDAELSDSGFRLNQIPELTLTRGIDSHFFLTVLNTSSQKRHILPVVQPRDSFVYAPVPLAERESTVFLVKIDGTSQVSELQIGIDDPTERNATVAIPVRWVDPAVIYGKTHDRGEGKLCASKVFVLCSDGVYRHAKEYAHNTTLSEKPVIFRPALYKLPFFYTNGNFEIVVPPGKTVVTCERGFEHPVITEEITFASGEKRDLTLETQRFIDMKSLGWISGDTHVHWTKNSWDENEDLDLLAMVQRAEDVRVVNNLTLYQWTSTGPFIKPDHFPMGPVPGYCSEEYHIQMGEEYRNDGFYGHINLLAIHSIIEPISTGRGSGGDETAFDYPTNKRAIDVCHAQGGIYTEAHGLGPFENGDTAVNAILGLADAIDQLDADYYYRLLNIGVEVPLGNGSDHPARIVGCARMYVKISSPFSYSSWLDGIREGRTFVTSGPLIFLRINGKDVGSRITVGLQEELSVDVKAISRRPLGTVQLLSNGEIIKTVKTNERETSFSVEMTADTSRWFVARCSSSDEFTIIRTAEDRYTARPDIAHTSAIYVLVDGKAVFDKHDAVFWLQRLRQHAEDIRNRARFEQESHRQEAVAHVTSAIQRLEEMMRSQ